MPSRPGQDLNLWQSWNIAQDMRVTTAHGGRSGVYVYRFGRPRPGRTDGRKGGRRADGRTDGRAEGRFEAQVPIFTGQMKKASKKRQKSIVFFDFSNHAGSQVPIFTPKMKNFRFAELVRLARLSTRKWDFRRRSRPRELAQRSQDDVSLNKLPQISC